MLRSRSKPTLAARRASTLPSSRTSTLGGISPRIVIDSPVISANIEQLQPPRLNTLPMPEKEKAPTSDTSPMSALSRHQTFNAGKMALKLYKDEYIPLWLYSRFNFDSLTSSRKAGKKLFSILQKLENDRKRASPLFNYSFAMLRESIKLNRYSDVFPYNYNRVLLPSLKGDKFGYINASHLYSLGKLRHYIAAQGPLPATIGNFWHMIWSECTGVIVMLTREEENARVKCCRYWPIKIGNQEIYHVKNGKFGVELVKETIRWDGDLIQRDFILSYEMDRSQIQTRRVRMLHFLEWPDHEASAPASILQLIDMANHLNHVASQDFIISEDLSEVSNEKVKLGPMVVHCSAGIGRTGTFCVIDSVLWHLQHLGGLEKITSCPMVLGGISEYDPHEWDQLPLNDLIALTVNHFRKQRRGCVQTSDQFMLCYDAVLYRLVEWQSSNIAPNWNVVR